MRGPILVTGAAGKTGLAVISALAGRGAAVRALARNDEQAAEARRAGAREAVRGDMRDPRALRDAAGGARGLYLIIPNMTEDEPEVVTGILEAAEAADVRQVVYHSVLRPQIRAMPHHWKKLLSEERLFAAEFEEVTILQPAAYMQNVLAGWDRIIEEGIHAVPYGVGTRIGMVDVRDVAQVGALVLTVPGYAGATYELGGGENLSQSELADVLGGVLGRDVRARETSRADWERDARTAGLAEYAINTLVAMFEYYEAHGFESNATVLTALLGRPPTTWERLVEELVA